jgi:hypothetical protein
MVILKGEGSTLEGVNPPNVDSVWSTETAALDRIKELKYGTWYVSGPWKVLD